MDIKELDKLIVVGLPVKANWKNLWVEMPRAWEQFFARHHEIEQQEGETFLDVSLEQKDKEYLQLVGTRVASVPHVPNEMRAIEIPAQFYIHHRHIGPVAGIAETFGTMYEWAELHGHAAGQFKIDMGYTTAGDELEHDLYIGMLPANEWRDIA